MLKKARSTGNKWVSFKIDWRQLWRYFVVRFKNIHQQKQKQHRRHYKDHIIEIYNSRTIIHVWHLLWHCDIISYFPLYLICTSKMLVLCLIEGHSKIIIFGILGMESLICICKKSCIIRRQRLSQKQLLLWNHVLCHKVHDLKAKIVFGKTWLGLLIKS